MLWQGVWVRSNGGLFSKIDLTKEVITIFSVRQMKSLLRGFDLKITVLSKETLQFRKVNDCQL